METNLDSQKSYISDLPKHLVINMPALSPTMTSGNIGVWKKKVGDKVSPGDVLCEIETDKATMDFECQEEGYVAKILIETGEKNVPVNKVFTGCIYLEGEHHNTSYYASLYSPSISSSMIPHP
jgi:hypothetical protein